MEAHKDNHKLSQKEPQEDKGISIKESEYLKLKGEADKLKDAQERSLRMQAELENARKRLEREKQDFIKYANEGLIVELLNVLDDLERAVSLAEARHQDLPAFLKGAEIILAHLYDLLKEHGVRPVEAQGKIFDPAFHEALMQVEDNAKPEHTVVEELQKGYLLYDRVIRTAKVKVSKRTTEQSDKK